MRYRAFFAILLVLSILLGTSSCGLILVSDMPPEETMEGYETAEPTQTPTFSEYTKYNPVTDGREVAQNYLDELPERDYAGGTFFITTPSAEYISPDNTASVVSRLAVERNATVEDLFNINIVTSVVESHTMLEAMRQAILSDVYYTDLLMLPSSEVGNFQSVDSLINMRTIPFFDLDKPYFNNSSSDATSAGYATYAVAGDASLNPTSYPAVYMNTDILNQMGVSTTEVYRDAARGEWTLDKMLGYARLAADNVANTITANSTADGFIDMIFKSAGNDYVIAEERKVPVIGYKPESVADTVSALRQIYSDPKATISAEENLVGAFSEGNTLFMIERLYVMPWLVNSSVHWGILPLPKGDEQDSYRSLMGKDQLLFAIPANHTNTEIASLTLMALNAASHGYIYDEYVEYNMTYVLRDNDSVNMLDLILDTAAFDFALTFGDAYPTIAEATYQLFNTSVENEEWDKDFREKMISATTLIRKSFTNGVPDIEYIVETEEVKEEKEEKETKPGE